MGIRAQESSARAKKVPFKLSAKNSKAGREWYDWMPIFDMEIGEVFQTIKDAGQKPHWAYSVGMSRLSCAFCIMASKKDLSIARKHNKKLYEKYLEVEKILGRTVFMVKKQPVPLNEYIDSYEKKMAEQSIAA